MAEVELTPPTDLRRHFAVGDLVTIGQVRADGTLGAPDAAHPLQHWRVKQVTPLGVCLQPLTTTGEVDAFNDAFGEFWIR